MKFKKSDIAKAIAKAKIAREIASNQEDDSLGINVKAEKKLFNKLLDNKNKRENDHKKRAEDYMKVIDTFRGYYEWGNKSFDKEFKQEDWPTNRRAWTGEERE